MSCLVGNASGVLPGVAADRVPGKFQVKYISRYCELTLRNGEWEMALGGSPEE